MFKKSLFFLILVVVLAAGLRLWQLGQVPVSMSDDEVRVAENAYSLSRTGKDIKGNLLPLAFEVDNYAFNPTPIYIASVFVKIFDLSMFSVRLPYALAALISILLLYGIALELTKNKAISILSSLVLALSVWHIQMSRIAYEGGFALFFYLLGIFIFLRMRKGNIVYFLLTMLSFLLAFNSYSGTKLIFIPIVITLLAFKLKEIKIKHFLIAGFFIFFAFASFAFLSKTQSASHYGSNQFFFQDTMKTAESVELERRYSTSPAFLERLYHNKATYLSKIFMERYLYAFSPQYLLISQEQNGTFALWFRGQLYQIEIVFLLLGAFYLFLKRRKEFLLMVAFLVIAPIPSGIGAYPISYTFRSGFMLPWLMILVGTGIYSLTSFVKKRFLLFGIYFISTLFYIYFIVGYLDQYYYNWANYGSIYYSKPAKDLVSFIDKNKKNKDEIIIAGGKSLFFLHYAFYNKIDPKIVQTEYLKEEIRIGNLSFEKECLDIRGKDSKHKILKNSLVVLAIGCPLPTKNKGAVKPDSTIKSFEGLDQWSIFETDRKLNF